MSEKERERDREREEYQDMRHLQVAYSSTGVTVSFFWCLLPAF